MRRVVAILAILAVVWIGSMGYRAAFRPTGPVELLTGGTTRCTDLIGDSIQAALSADRTLGTVIIGNYAIGMSDAHLFGTTVPHTGPPETPRPITTISWPTGFTGRWVGDQIEVLDTNGKVVATTGRRYDLIPQASPPARDAYPACRAVPLG